MKKGILCALLAIVALAGGVYAFFGHGSCPGCLGLLLASLRSGRPSPVASIQERAPHDTLRPGPNGATVSDEDARARVLQLIDLEVLSEVLSIKNPCPSNGPECEESSNRDYFEFGVRLGVQHPILIPSDAAIMPYADEETPAIMPDADEAVIDPNARFDLWMLLFQISPPNKSVGSEESSEPKPPRKMPAPRDPRLNEESPPHPEVDTLEFRPSDAKKGEYEAFQRRPI